VTRRVVGISAALERVRWGVWDQEVAMAPKSYADAVQRAGAVALILPPDTLATDDPGVLLDRLDGLILAGGADMDPATYGAPQVHPQTKGFKRERDLFEIALTRGALEREMPVLGVCRGMQVLNVALGGTLHQHLPDVVGHEDHRHTPGSFGDHEVKLEPGSLAARAAGGDRVLVKSHHHQGIDRVGEGLAVTGWAYEPEEVPEAVEIPGRDFALGVQWHPEEDVRDRVIGALVEATSRVEAG
jgi:putative glutamine amidotransferase